MTTMTHDNKFTNHICPHEIFYRGLLPVVALLACETLQVVHIAPGSHDHLERRYVLEAGRAHALIAKHPVKPVNQ